MTTFILNTHYSFPCTQQRLWTELEKVYYNNKGRVYNHVHKIYQQEQGLRKFLIWKLAALKLEFPHCKLIKKYQITCVKRVVLTYKALFNYVSKTTVFTNQFLSTTFILKTHYSFPYMYTEIMDRTWKCVLQQEGRVHTHVHMKEKDVQMTLPSQRSRK